MTDHHSILEAGCRREVGDLLNLRDANLAAIMQMDIDAPIVAFREAEHDAKLAEDIAVNSLGIDARPVPTPSFSNSQSTRRTRRHEQSRLRKRDELHVDNIAIGGAQLQHRLHMLHADIGRDIDMGTDMQ